MDYFELIVSHINKILEFFVSSGIPEISFEQIPDAICSLFSLIANKTSLYIVMIVFNLFV